MKNIFKVILLLICFSCNQDDPTLLLEQEVDFNSASSTLKHEEVDPANIPEIIDFISKQKVGLMSSNSNRSAEDGEGYYFGDVNLDHIMALINDEQSNDKTYTFNISTPDFYDQWANLIIRVIEGEIIRAYINVYSPSPEYLESDGLGFKNNFSGTIESFGLEGSGIDFNRSVDKLGTGLNSLKSVALVEGIAESITQSDECDNDTNTNDDDTNTGNNGTGNNNDDGSNGTDHQDTTDGGMGTGTGDGGGGNIVCIEIEGIGVCCERNECDPHAPAFPYPLCSGVDGVIVNCYNTHSEANTDGDDPLGGETTNTRMSDCPDDDVIVINPACIMENIGLRANSPFNVNLTSVNSCNEEHIETPEDEKFMCLYRKLAENPNFQNLFLDIFGESEVFDAKFVIVDNIVGANGKAKVISGQTDPQTGQLLNLNIEIEIDRGYMQSASAIAVAKTILHETIHAYLIFKYFSCEQSEPFGSIADDVLANLLNEYFLDCAPGEGQHEFMFTMMIPTMTAILADLRDDLIPANHQAGAESQMFVNEDNPTIDPISGDFVQDMPWDWNEFYKYLSLAGLQNSSAFHFEYPDDSAGFANYQKYIDTGINSFRKECMD